MFHVVIYCPGSARKPGQPLSAQLSEAKVESGTSPTAFKGLVSSPGLDKCDAASPSLSSIQLILVSGTSRARTTTHLVGNPHAAVRVRYAPAEARPLTSGELWPRVRQRSYCGSRVRQVWRFGFTDSLWWTVGTLTPRMLTSKILMCSRLET